MMNKVLMLLVLIGCGTLSCKKETITPDESGPIQFAEASLPDNRKITLFADREHLSVGYNPIYIRIEDASGKTDKQATVEVTPLMDMHSMTHSSPVEQPVFAASLNLYAGAVVFTMPSGDMGAWKLTVTVDGRSVDVAVTVTGAPTGNRPVGSFDGLDGISYTIALVHPRAPRTGTNDLEILVSRRQDMHHYPPVDGLAITVEPEMPSMNHGSPNNVDPTGVGDGRYRGKVNFTMTGDWRLHFSLKRDGEVIVEDAFLDVLF